ncbi:MAG TPA: UDP-N-acetyl-D-mannosamine dehydrogenase [Candidatus Desulfovibrio intestinavium]|uniref:UDP-N-acetyl-D-mannosamine dehydrogenase n=1 Tax=Candidatus Desulfovibrio intestinavium TaxID=2838534 RepID=A0A9D2KRK6_9BACT|nr:UDP-N-acetyl-D-mannosamine dehydrogenase [Candidatus Desulfovibrio intestinavium]
MIPQGATHPLDVCILGLGYIGLPTASLLATKGFRVHGVDVNEVLIQNLQQGKCVIYEPALDVMVKSALQSGKLTADTRPREADIFIICVPTPFAAGHKPDLRHVRAAAAGIAPLLRNGNLVILESTVPVGATEGMAETLASMRPDLRIGRHGPENAPPVHVAHCPERVLPGRILHELVENDRIVGGIDPESTRMGVAFYRGFVSGNVQGTDSRTAEMIKLTENSFRDVNIAFANELSLICKELGLDVWEVIALANRHPRVNILQPGAGVGGHCIAVDPWFLVDSAPETARLIRTAREVNDAKPEKIIAQTLEAVARMPHATVACLGLAFKPDIDDLRESPALSIAEALAGKNMPLVICEPHIHHLPPSLQGKPHVRHMPLADCLQQGDIILALVGHKAFAAIDAETLAGKTVIDACGLWRNRRPACPEGNGNKS